MYQGNWTCSTCGGSITELPFEPKSNKGLTCRDCYFKAKNGGGSPAEGTTSGVGVAPVEVTADIDDRDVPPFDPDEVPVASEPAPDSPDREAAPAATGERKLFEGDWKCSVCGGNITSLPFEPRGDASNLKCIDCFKKSRST